MNPITFGHLIIRFSNSVNVCFVFEKHEILIKISYQKKNISIDQKFIKRHVTFP